MAFFKMIRDEQGKAKKYKTEADLYNLINYVLRESMYTETHLLIPGDAVIIANQFLYSQNCSGIEQSTRALHYMLSYDSVGWEHEMDVKSTMRSISMFRLLMSQFQLEEFEALFVVHDNGKNCNIHIIINPVSKITRRRLHYSLMEYQLFLRELAKELYMRNRLALCGVSYIDEQGKLVLDSGTGKLYENRMYPYESLKGRNK